MHMLHIYAYTYNVPAVVVTLSKHAFIFVFVLAERSTKRFNCSAEISSPAEKKGFHVFSPLLWYFVSQFFLSLDFPCFKRLLTLQECLICEQQSSTGLFFFKPWVYDLKWFLLKIFRFLWLVDLIFSSPFDTIFVKDFAMLTDSFF